MIYPTAQHSPYHAVDIVAAIIKDKHSQGLDGPLVPPSVDAAFVFHLGSSMD